MVIPAIIRKELLGSGRHGRYFAVRAGYVVLLACLTIPMLLDQVDRMANNPSFHAFRMGRDFGVAFGLLQFALVVLLAPALSIGAIATERASGGLALLQAAGVRPLQIVTGKYAARMAWLGLFLVSGLPLLFSGTLMGGLGGEAVALIFVHCAVAGALATSVGFTISGGMRQSVPALVLAYLLLLTFYVAPVVVVTVLDRAISGFHLTNHLAWASPVASIVLFTVGEIPSRQAWLGITPHAGLAFVLAFPVLRFVGSAREGGGASFGRRSPTAGADDRNVGSSTLGDVETGKAVDNGDAVRGAAPGSPERLAVLPWTPRVRGNPVAWRDARSARRGLSSRILRWAYVSLGLLTIASAIVLAISLPRATADLGRIGIMLLLLAGGLVALVVGSGALAEERESRGLALLRISNLSAREILAGKLWGMCVHLWPVAVMPVLLAGLLFSGLRTWLTTVRGGYEAAALDPAVMGLTALLTIAILFCASSAGLFFSALCRKSATAAGLSISAALTFTFLPPVILKLARVHQVNDWLPSFNPLLTIVALCDGFGRSYGRHVDRPAATAAMAGIVFMFILGGLLLAFCLAALEYREEG